MNLRELGRLLRRSGFKVSERPRTVSDQHAAASSHSHRPRNSPVFASKSCQHAPSHSAWTRRPLSFLVVLREGEVPPPRSPAPQPTGRRRAQRPQHLPTSGWPSYSQGFERNRSSLTQVPQVTKAREAVQRVRARLDAIQHDKERYQEEHGIVPKGYDLSDPARRPEEVSFVEQFIAHDQCIRDLTEAVEALLARSEHS